MLGYCPQQSILYDTLTVVEHLHLYSTLKGSKSGEVRLLSLVKTFSTSAMSIVKVEQLLAAMRMEDKAEVQCGKLSEVNTNGFRQSNE